MDRRPKTPVVDFISAAELDDELSVTVMRLATYLIYARAGERQGLAMESTNASLAGWRTQLLQQAGNARGAELFRALDDHLELAGAYDEAGHG